MCLSEINYIYLLRGTGTRTHLLINSSCDNRMIIVFIITTLVTRGRGSIRNTNS